ncbi:MSMEG_0565 family glycosyltransferase [Paraburkholderia kururiensis]|uniref:MSMEG_0565 family glycosyltransferase n=1 Tax=Paraburkholderia kururiensis TaxID=984307 RepID=A0ABZ0WSY9_9BURK|nr:MSMEG_0565 family glycosyltransferase [Paraburkholderia kururiensis]WQD80499.1 MSMEG_0565 family glycosyltransferase [Paraburkholderia kururiensis]
MSNRLASFPPSVPAAARPVRALRVALFTHSVNPRGGVVHTLELARALNDRGCDVTVFAPAAEGETMFRRSPCRVVLARVTERPASTVAMVETRIAALRRALLDVLLERGADYFDILHAGDSISGNALAQLKEEGHIAGFVRTVHHLDVFDDLRLEHWQRRAWHDADVVLCVSDAWAQRMRRDHGVAALTVPNGVDVERFGATPADEDPAVRQRLGITRDGGPVVLAVGGVEARKNTLMLLEAFARLRQAAPAAQLVIAGGASLLDHDAYARQFAARAAACGLRIGRGAAVVLTGTVDDAAMPALFRSADVVAMVSVREGFGLVVLEALASGRPVVVSRIAPFTEYLDERACVWANPFDAESIADALRRALHARGGIDFAQAVPALLQRFSWAASARRHVQIYEAWLAGRRLAAT